MAPILTGSASPARGQLEVHAPVPTGLVLVSALCTRASTAGDANAYPTSEEMVERLNTTPITDPSGATSGPPELPGKTVASIS
jgi:hypothetical protein